MERPNPRDDLPRLGLFRAFTGYPSLTWELTRRDVLGRYRGASFGLLWALLNPFLMLIVYTIAFGYVLRSRWPHSDGSTTDYALILFVGLIIHGIFAECLNRAPTLIVGNANLVKRIIFPLDILPWPVVLSALFQALMNIVVFAILMLAFQHRLPWTIVLLPVVLLPLAMLCVGVCWFLSALGVFLRDISQMTGVIATAMLFLSSAIVPVTVVPERFRIIFYINPLTFLIDQARDVAIWGHLPLFGWLLVYLVCATTFAALAYQWFRKTRRGFADVL